MEKQRHTAKSVMELFRQLPEGERAELLKMLGEAQDGNEDLETMLTEKRFSGGRVCPICGGVHVQRNGRRANGSQKFVCKDCGKTFSIRKNTIFSGTHKSASVWKEFLRCMSEGLSLDKTAERCGITHATAFVWRHKVLDAIGDALKDTELTGIVEADEAFLPVSYKGDRKAFDGGGCGRKPRKRGGCNHKRGLSDELVCLPCAVDRKGKAIGRVAKLGKCSAAAVKAVLGPRVRQGHALHGRRGLVPQVLEGQRQRAGADQGRQGYGEGNLPHTAPQRLPLQAEGLPRLVQGRVHQVPQQLPDLEQRNGSRSQPGGKGLGPDGHCRFSLVLGNLPRHT